MDNEKTAVQCPNCQGPAIKEGNKITCEPCDATFTITKTGGARVKETGKIEDHETRLKKVEDKLFGGNTEPAHNGEIIEEPEEPEENIIPG